MLTSWLCVSCCSTRISEYSEQEPNFFGTLSFGQGHCHPMPKNIFLALPADKFLCPLVSFSHSCRDYLMTQLCFILLFSLEGLGYLFSEVYTLQVHIQSHCQWTLPPSLFLSAPRWPLCSRTGFSFQLLTCLPPRRWWWSSPRQTFDYSLHVILSDRPWFKSWLYALLVV